MRNILSALLLASLAAPAFAEDWPQWRGPTRDGISTEKNLIAEIPEAGPRQLWSAKVGKGYSTVAVVGGKVFTQGTDKGKESIICLDLETGKELWRHPTNRPEAESANTPAVVGGKVYALVRAGELVCLDAESGKVIWTKDAKDLGGNKPQYQFACSPLILGDAVIFDVGATVAISQKTGDVLWKSGGGNPSYGSPVPFKSGDDTLLATFKPFGLVVINSKDGKDVAKYEWKTAYDVNAATPIIAGNNSIFISSGYGHGCAKVELEGGKLTKAYETKDMQNQYTTSVLVDGFVYGLSDGKKLTCVNLATGKAVWTKKEMGAGGIIAADGKLIMMCDGGILAMAEINPKECKFLGESQILKNQCWTAPVLSGGKLFCRNTEGTLVCLDMKK